MSAVPHLFSLVASTVGQPAAEWLQRHVDVPRGLDDFAWSDTAIHRAWLAEALGLCLFHSLVRAVPDGRRYVEEQTAAGRKVVFDHGAFRTVDWHETGELPRGRQAFTRILEPLGFSDVRTYALTKLHVTGWAFRQMDLPEDIAQFFVAEFHPGRLSETFQATVSRVLASSRDPLDSTHLSILRRLRSTRHCSLEEATQLLPVLCRAFARQHGVVSEADYRQLLSESESMAWIATEGNSFNHLTDRVDDLQTVVEEQIRLERPIKDSIEVSTSGRVMQTAYRSCTVIRDLLDDQGKLQPHAVPGSFVEFITRKVDPDTGTLDLNFDSNNAQGIIRMTETKG